MKKVNIVIVLAALSLLTSCKKAMNSQEIYDKTASGVVLILNYFYYSVTLPDDTEIYFTGVDDNGQLEGLTYDQDEAWDNCSACTGTGFFISNDGLIMTNRHVAQPEISEGAIKAFLKGYKKMLKGIYQEKKSKLATMFYNYEGNVVAQNELARQYQHIEKILEHIDDMDMNDAEFNTYSKVSIAYNDMHVIKFEDFKPCTVISVSDDEAVDLATIQLDDCTTPEDCYIFQLRDNDEQLTLDQKLYMIGFNRGFSIAKTAQGIRSQCYSGNVTQKDDGEKILYSIPSQSGSSGSPVIDEYGNLVAVNFAGYTGTQGFNYGIPSKRIRQFLLDN